MKYNHKIHFKSFPIDVKYRLIFHNLETNSKNKQSERERIIIQTMIKMYC